MTVTNTGSVATMGIQSDAIVVQSIGGGGGKAGGTVTSSSENWTSPGVSPGVSVGGGTQGSAADPYATNGAQASITNTGEIYTTGALSNGLVAQSIAMGGGIGGSSTVTNAGSSGPGSGDPCHGRGQFLCCQRQFRGRLGDKLGRDHHAGP